MLANNNATYAAGLDVADNATVELLGCTLQDNSVSNNGAGMATRNFAQVIAAGPGRSAYIANV